MKSRRSLRALPDRQGPFSALGSPTASGTNPKESQRPVFIPRNAKVVVPTPKPRMPHAAYSGTLTY